MVNKKTERGYKTGTNAYLISLPVLKQLLEHKNKWFSLKSELFKFLKLNYLSSDLEENETEILHYLVNEHAF